MNFVDSVIPLFVKFSDSSVRLVVSGLIILYQLWFDGYWNSCDRGFSFERNCVLRRWESETLK